jgi:hypothetical protein
MNITTLVNDKSIEATTEIANEETQCNQKSRFTIVKLPINRVNSRFTEVFSEKNNDKSSWNIDTVYDQKIKPMLEAFAVIKDFVDKYKQDFQQTYEKLKEYGALTSIVYKDNNRNPIAIAKLAISLKNDMQNQIQSFKFQDCSLEFFFNNPQIIEIIEKKYNIVEVITLVKAIGFYSVIYDKTGDALNFCKELSKFIRKTRELSCIPNINNIINEIENFHSA